MLLSHTRFDDEVWHAVRCAHARFSVGGDPPLGAFPLTDDALHAALVARSGPTAAGRDARDALALHHGAAALAMLFQPDPLRGARAPQNAAELVVARQVEERTFETPEGIRLRAATAGNIWASLYGLSVLMTNPGGARDAAESAANAAEGMAEVARTLGFAEGDGDAPQRLGEAHGRRTHDPNTTPETPFKLFTGNAPDFGQLAALLKVLAKALPQIGAGRRIFASAVRRAHEGRDGAPKSLRRGGLEAIDSADAEELAALAGFAGPLGRTLALGRAAERGLTIESGPGQSATTGPLILLRDCSGSMSSNYDSQAATLFAVIEACQRQRRDLIIAPFGFRDCAAIEMLPRGRFADSGSAARALMHPHAGYADFAALWRVVGPESTAEPMLRDWKRRGLVPDVVFLTDGIEQYCTAKGSDDRFPLWHRRLMDWKAESGARVFACILNVTEETFREHVSTHSTGERLTAWATELCDVVDCSNTRTTDEMIRAIAGTIARASAPRRASRSTVTT